MCGGLITILEELKVEQVIIGKQFEYCENLERFLEIAKENNVKINVVKVGSRIILDKECYLDVFWPDSRQSISENSINNNALVCKLSYKDFSMLFTGDIEEEAEKVLVSKYNGTDILKSTVLKIAHHGSSSSSTKEFLDLVQPKLALVGVGKSNLYGHPNDEVLKRLETLKCKVYRTDENGEITIEFNSKLIYKIKICNKKLNIM